MTHKRAAMSNSTISRSTSTSQFLVDPPMMRSLFLLLLCSPLTRTRPRGWCASDVDCPSTDPVCSEWGFCQCASYKPGGAACWGRGGDGDALVPLPPPLQLTTRPIYNAPPAPGHTEEPNQDNQHGSSQEPPTPTASLSGLYDAPPLAGAPAPGAPWNLGACSSAADCPPASPMCSEWGYCQSRARRCASNEDCATSHPICSEWGYCQCASYQPGGPAC